MDDMDAEGEEDYEDNGDNGDDGEDKEIYCFCQKLSYGEVSRPVRFFVCKFKVTRLLNTLQYPTDDCMRQS